MIRSTVARVALGVASLVLVAPSLMFGHAVVYPKASTPGAYEKYVLRVPNEKDIPTTRVEIRFPADLRVSSFEDVPGWQLALLTDSAKRIIGAVWTGSLVPHRFVELPFVAANPKADATLTWPVFQTYASGERVEWTGPQGSKTPASSTTVAAVREARSSSAWVAWVALVMALLSLGLALRRPDARRAV
jgi:uncharacterized protein YcnI